MIEHFMEWLKRPSNSFKMAIQHCKMQYRAEEKLLHGCKTCSGAPEALLQGCKTRSGAPEASLHPCKMCSGAPEAQLQLKPNRRAVLATTNFIITMNKLRTVDRSKLQGMEHYQCARWDNARCKCPIGGSARVVFKI